MVSRRPLAAASVAVVAGLLAGCPAITLTTAPMFPTGNTTAPAPTASAGPNAPVESPKLPVTSPSANMPQVQASANAASPQPNATPQPAMTSQPAAVPSTAAQPDATPAPANPNQTPSPTTIMPTIAPPNPNTTGDGTTTACAALKPHYFQPVFRDGGMMTAGTTLTAFDASNMTTRIAAGSKQTAAEPILLNVPEGCPLQLTVSVPWSPNNVESSVPFNVIVNGMDSAANPIRVNFPILMPGSTAPIGTPPPQGPVQLGIPVTNADYIRFTPVGTFFNLAITAESDVVNGMATVNLVPGETYWAWGRLNGWLTNRKDSSGNYIPVNYTVTQPPAPLNF